MKQLTPNQIRVVQFLREFIEWNGYAPTLDEIAGRLDVTKPTVQQYLAALEAKGVIRRERYAHRAIELIAEEPGGPRVPLVGRIAAGEPIEAIEEREMLDLPDLIGMGAGRDLFLLQVRGDSMIEEGIFDGDYVLAERRASADNGATVVALLPDGTATLKKLYRERGRIRLQPAHPSMEPIYVKELQVQGVVRGVFRSVK